MKNTLPLIIVVVLIAAAGAWWLFGTRLGVLITTFEECVGKGNPVMESYPRQCRDGERTFTENIGNELEKIDLIRISTPRPNQTISSPLTIRGEARGTWFFEASFPVVLTDWDGRIIAEGIAQAKNDWMTTDFVPFEATLTFTVDKNAYSNKGSLILRKDNPSGLPQNDDALEIPIVIAGIIGTVKPPPTACTQEAKLCSDGSAVGRTGPNCEFAPCPSAGRSCLKDSDCPSPQYLCQETQGMGTACPSNDPPCVPTHITITGECKVKEGYGCSADAQCAAGALCHNGLCAAPIGRQCSGPSDMGCPTDFECKQGCGSPVGYEGEPPPPYFCQLQGYQRTCPICLAKDTLIDTPLGAVAVQEMRVGDAVWTKSASGARVVAFVTKVSKTLAPPMHTMVKLVLEDGRALLVSPGHPTAHGHTAGDLVEGNVYDGARVVTASRVAYAEGYTYDLLPAGATGFYWANGILLGSTLR